MRCASTWRRRSARVGDLSWREGEEGSIAADPAAWGDVVLARKDSPTSYHLSVVVDDALQGVTHVARGRDLYPSTSVHRLLQELLGLPAPFYRHHRLILDSDGRKLSKSNHSTAIRELRAAGATPSDIRRMTGSRSRRIWPPKRPVAWFQGRESCRRPDQRKPKSRRARKKAQARPRSKKSRRANADNPTEAALASLAHDIRTPLTGILALAELLAASDLGERERRWASA